MNLFHAAALAAFITAGLFLTWNSFKEKQNG